MITHDIVHVPLLHTTGGEGWASDCCVGWLPGPALVHITISTDTELADKIFGMRDWYMYWNWWRLMSLCLILHTTILHKSTAESIHASVRATNFVVRAARSHLQRPGRVAVELVQNL